MAERTFGWVQEAYTIGNLKRTVSALVPGSEMNRRLREDLIPRLVPASYGRDRFIRELGSDPVVIPYGDLKGKGIPAGETRGTSPCSGIIQAALPGQGREYQSDWPADSYLRWAISVGFLYYDRASDTCSLTESGLRYAQAEEGGGEEERLLTRALLSNPPVCRILSLLDGGGTLTKFEIGAELGFVGEAGFTSIPQHMIVLGLAEAKTQKERIRLLQDIEGTSDKYVRTVCSWLKQMGWVRQVEKEAVAESGGRAYRAVMRQSYCLTLKGKTVLKYIAGTSKFPRVAKRVPCEMLATKTADRYYLRSRRARLIRYLQGGYRTVSDMVLFLNKEGITEDEETVRDDLKGLERIGLSLRRKGNAYRIMDEITDLELPREKETAGTAKSEVTKVKDVLRRKLSQVDHKYLVLLDLGFDGKSDRDYEIQTAELLTTELGFEGKRLGDTRKPDICVYRGNSGLIVDNKAYSKGYTLPIKQADEMFRYLDENEKRSRELNPNEWWKIFGEEVTKFRFAFVSGGFTGGFRDRIENLYRRSGIKGAAISSENLLLLAEEIKAGRMSHEEAMELFDCRGEITVASKCFDE